MTIDTAEGGGHADRASDVRAYLEGGQPGRQRGRAAPTAAARGAREVPRIARAPVDRIGRLPVREHGRDIRLAEEDRSRCAQAGRRRRVMGGHVTLPLGHAAGSPEAGNVDGFLERDGQAEQRPRIAPRNGQVGGARACWRARSKSRTKTALRRPSYCSIRWM